MDVMRIEKPAALTTRLMEMRWTLASAGAWADFNIFGWHINVPPWTVEIPYGGWLEWGIDRVLELVNLALDGVEKASDIYASFLSSIRDIYVAIEERIVDVRLFVISWVSGLVLELKGYVEGIVAQVWDGVGQVGLEVARLIGHQIEQAYLTIAIFFDEVIFSHMSPLTAILAWWNTFRNEAVTFFTDPLDYIGDKVLSPILVAFLTGFEREILDLEQPKEEDDNA